jgi:phage/plasmid primase-like uncharacterized protein
MRFAKQSRKHGCFHVVGAANGAAALQKIAMSPVVVIAETYAMATTISKNAKVAAIAAFYSGNFYLSQHPCTSDGLTKRLSSSATIITR